LDPNHKAVVSTVRDAFEFLFAVANMEAEDTSMLPNPITRTHKISTSKKRWREWRVVKLDVEKLLEPKEWGWRFVGADLQMANGQMVECYVVFAAMEQVSGWAPSAVVVVSGWAPSAVVVVRGWAPSAVVVVSGWAPSAVVVVSGWAPSAVVVRGWAPSAVVVVRLPVQ
jgi:hypothetical protein